VEIAP